MDMKTNASFMKLLSVKHKLNKIKLNCLTWDNNHFLNLNELLDDINKLILLKKEELNYNMVDKK